VMSKSNHYKSSVIAIILIVSLLPLTLLEVNAQEENIWGDVPPRETTLPPEINIQSPTNNTHYNTNNITLSFNVKVGKSLTATQKQLKTITYKTDWQPNSIKLYEDIADLIAPPGIAKFTTSINLTKIPDGKHTITIYANERGTYFGRVYPFSPKYYTFFEIDSSVIVNFSVDTVSPVVTSLSPQNQSYTDANVTLSVNLDEFVSELKYSLDGLENVTFTGNTTLSSFEYGKHNVTVYATDLVGHSSISDTIYFSIEPFPTLLILTSIIILVVGAGIFVYFKKCKRRS